MAETAAGGKQEAGLRPSRIGDGSSTRAKSKQETKAGSLRASGLGVLQEFHCNSNMFAATAPVTSSFLDGADGTGRLLNIHNAVANRNVEAAKVVLRLEGAESADADGRMGSTWPGAHRKGPGTKRNNNAARRRGSGRASVADEDPTAAIGGTVEIDSQALAAEFDSVSAALRVLLSDNPSSNQVTVTRQIKSENEHADEDDGEGEKDEQKKRILRYRFVRKIEDPPPPLQGLDELPPEKKISTDKIERNKRHTFLSWSQGIKERTWQRNQAKAERSTVARQRREVAENSLLERMAERFTQLESITNCHAKPEIQDRLLEKVTQRNTRLLKAKERREENEVRRLERLRTELEGKQARGMASIASPPGSRGPVGVSSGASAAAAANAQTSVCASQAQQASSASAPTVAAPAGEFRQAPTDATTAGGEATASDAPAGLTIFELFSWDDLDEEERTAKQQDRIPEEDAVEAEEQVANASSQDAISAWPTDGESAEAGGHRARGTATGSAALE